MNGIIALIQGVLLRVVLTTVLVASTLFLSAFFSSGNSFQAHAEALTPEASSYQVGGDVDDKAQNIGEDAANTTKNKIEGAADNIREKLNLDQPIYPGTKKVIKQVQDRAEQRVKGEPSEEDAPRGQRS